MNKKILFLGAIISSCVIAFISGQSMADYRNPNMPSGNRCYGDGQAGQYAPNGYSYGYNAQGSYANTSRQANPSGYGYNGDMGMGSPAKPLQTESAEKFEGTISSLNRVQYPDGTQIEMILDTNEGTKKIMLGPSRFLDQSKVKVQVGDKVVVTGYRVGANGNEVIVAQEVNKNGFVLQLRSDQRQPMWQEPQYMYGGSQAPNMGRRPSSSNPNQYFPVNRTY